MDFVHKRVKISVDEWFWKPLIHTKMKQIYECNGYQFFFWSTIKLKVSFLQSGWVDFGVDE